MTNYTTTMKHFLLLTLCAALAACGGTDTSDGMAGHDGMNGSVATTTGMANPAVATTWNGTTEAYLDLKDALVDSDLDAARAAATTMRERLTGADMMAMGDAHDAFMRHHATLLPVLEQLASANDLDAARAAFERLTAPMVTAVGELGEGGRELYEQHCPMAFDNAGANWLSDEAAIRNPYFGDAMLTCGRVVNEL